ncbi:MAG: dehydrogenase, partial [Methanosarcinaceae archaeon]
QSKFYHFLEGTFENNFVHVNIEHLAELGNHHLVHGHHGEPLIILWMPIIVGVAGLLISFFIYYLRVIDMSTIVSRRNPVYQVLYNRYYQHQIFIELIALQITYGLSLVGEFIDRKIIDGIIDGVSDGMIAIGETIRKVQTGVVQSYATAVIAGVGLLIVLLTLIGEVQL